MTHDLRLLCCLSASTGHAIAGAAVRGRHPRSLVEPMVGWAQRTWWHGHSDSHGPEMARLHPEKPCWFPQANHQLDLFKANRCGPNPMGHRNWPQLRAILCLHVDYIVITVGCVRCQFISLQKIQCGKDVVVVYHCNNYVVGYIICVSKYKKCATWNIMWMNLR